MGAFKIAKTVLRSMFEKPATLMYPVVEREYPERTRGSVDIDVEQCILCGLCTRRCPAKAIETKRNTGEWIIHRMKCIQCGECIDVCPKECLSRNCKYTEPDAEKVVDVFEVSSVKKESAAMAGEGVKEKLACDMDACVFCGLCVKNCPVDALKVNRAEKIWEVDEAACVKCGACIDKCPKKCLTFEEAGKPAAASEEKQPAAEAKPAAVEQKPAASKPEDMLGCNLEECIFCGLCARNCPVDALAVDRAEKRWKVDQEACIKCEACISKCPKECLFMGEPPEAPESRENEAAEKSVPVLDVEKCVYCRMCENTCPEEAISAEMDNWTLDADKCISCRACIDVCPADALKMS